MDPRAGEFTALIAQEDEMKDYLVYHVKDVNDLRMGYIVDYMVEQKTRKPSTHCL